MTKPHDIQIGGDHYKNLPIQPIDYAMANGLGGPEHSVVKYVTRWRNKGGIMDLQKAIHVLQLMIEHETDVNSGRKSPAPQAPQRTTEGQVATRKIETASGFPVHPDQSGSWTADRERTKLIQAIYRCG